MNDIFSNEHLISPNADLSATDEISTNNRLADTLEGSALPLRFRTYLMAALLLLSQYGCTLQDKTHAGGLQKMDIIGCDRDTKSDKLSIHIRLITDDLLSNFSVEVSDRGEVDRELQLDNIGRGNDDPIYLDKNRAHLENPLATDGVIDATLTLKHGKEVSSDLMLEFSWTGKNGRPQHKEIRHIPCIPEYDGYAIESAELLSCTYEDGELITEVQYTVGGSDQDGVLQNFSFGDTEGRRRSYAYIQGKKVWEGQKVDIILTGDGTFIVIYHIPHGSSTTKITPRRLAETSSQEEERIFTSDLEDCDACDERKVTGRSFQRVKNNHCRGHAVFAVDGCDMQGRINIWFGASSDILVGGGTYITYTLTYADGRQDIIRAETNSIEHDVPYGTSVVGLNIVYVAPKKIGRHDCVESKIWSYGGDQQSNVARVCHR